MMSRFLTHATPKEVAEYGFKIMQKRKSFGVQGLMNKFVVFSGRLTPRNLLVSMTGKLLKGE